MRLPKLRAQTSYASAWRGVYVTVNEKSLGRVVLDPTDPKGPRLTIAFPVGWYRSCAGLIFPRVYELRIPLPTVRYRSNMSAFRGRLFVRVDMFWHSLSGLRQRDWTFLEFLDEDFNRDARARETALRGCRYSASTRVGAR